MCRNGRLNRLGWLAALGCAFFLLTSGGDSWQPATGGEGDDLVLGLSVQHARAAPAPKPAAQDPFPPTGDDSLSPKQRRDLLKHNFEKMKRDADELLELAKSLQQALNESHENVLSLKIVEKADKIEKLAKRIKGAAKGY